MMRIVPFALGLAMTGCSSIDKPVQDDFLYQSFGSVGSAGVKTHSRNTGTSFEVYGECSVSGARYEIRNTGRPRDARRGSSWFAYLGDKPFIEGRRTYADTKSFLSALETLQVAKDRPKTDSTDRIMVSSGSMRDIAANCDSLLGRKEKPKAGDSASSPSETSDWHDKMQILAGTIERETGVSRMPFYPNQMNFNDFVGAVRNGLVSMKSDLNKFVWLGDGDFRITQVAGRSAFMQSYSYASLFMPVKIITDKQAIEGQAWSQVSDRPLQFLGVTSYTTTLGAVRQALLFKEL
ncbi:hypothetical protein ACX3X6_08875 [Pseudomonas sichuanensis]